VGVCQSDVPSCWYYRAHGPAKVLHDRGELELVELPPMLRVRFANRRYGEPEPVGLVEVPRVDVVVFVRGVFPLRMHDIIRFLQREGVAVVVDYDDAYDRLPSQLHSLYKINPQANPYYNWRNALAAAKLADVVTVSTPALRRYRPDAVLLRNCMPRRYLRLGRRALETRDGKLVGWSGVIAGHPGDLRQCRSGVAEALRATGAWFLNVGDGAGVQQELGLDEPPEVSGVVGFLDYPKHLARLDVGIAPLVLDEYRDQGKSFLKPLESLALGSQYVASPSSEYRLLQRQLEDFCARGGATVPGQLAGAKGRHWKRALLAALGAASTAAGREQLAETAQAFVAEHWLMEDRAHLWGEAYELAAERRHRVPALS
jgi:hypothetical protein